jgi:hypothetical protein
MSAAAAGVKGRFSDIGASRQGAVREQRLMLAVLIDVIDVLQSCKVVGARADAATLPKRCIRFCSPRLNLAPLDKR